ncbi:MAG: 50S ribosomal protein L11 methyltransferase [Candidatus Nitrotoga sp.]
MAWLTLAINASADQAEILSESLLELGALSVDIGDAEANMPGEQAIFGEPGEPKPMLWSQSCVTALFAADVAMDTILIESARAIGLQQLPAYRIQQLADTDWVRLTQAQFDPIRISGRLWIVPTWHTPTDPRAINITLDPGLAFGTGSHPTTRLCLRWLDNNLQEGETVLDYGCGSGILAIAALKLGAGTAIGIDIDKQAIQASRDNAAANQVAAQFFMPEDAPPLSDHAMQADIVIANILTNPLKVLAPLLATAVREGGQLVLSGILSGQATEVMDIYAPWFTLKPPIEEDGWVCLSGVKQPNVQEQGNPHTEAVP